MAIAFPSHVGYRAIMGEYAADLADVRAARERIRARIHHTPVFTSQTLNAMAGRSLFLKCEMFQRVGAFKFRGACNAVMKLDGSTANLGVVTHSSGNHAQALALAAQMRGIAAHIVMPEGAPTVKRRAVEAYGGTIYTCAPTQAAREAEAERVRQKTGATLIPPYDHPDIIAGQGTMALELLEDVPDLDAIVAPIGGGGMLSGVALAATELKPGIRVFGAEPMDADDAARSKQAGALIPQSGTATVADGLRTSLGEHTWPVVRDFVEEIVTVGEDAIVAATRLVWERVKVVVEPSGAVPVAAVLSHRFRELSGVERVGVVLSGGNVDLDRLPWS